MIRDRAELLRDGILRSRGEALLPITLAGFILDALTMPGLQKIAYKIFFLIQFKNIGV